MVTFSNLESMILASANSASFWIVAASFGVAMPPDRFIPLVMGELGWQMPCS